MLREMLQQELPEALVLWEKRPRLQVPQMHWAFAGLAGLGAQWLSISLMRGVLFVAAYLTRSPLARTAEVTEVISWAVAAVVSLASARRRGLIALIAITAALEVIRYLLAYPGSVVFCEQSRFMNCPPDALTRLVDRWPVAAGLALGLITRRMASPGPSGVFALPLGASVVVVIPLFAYIGIAIALGPMHLMPRPLLEPLVAAQVLAALAMGVIASYWGTRPVVAALVVSGAYLLAWIPYFLQQMSERPVPFHFESMWQSLTPTFFAGAALIGLGLGVILRRRAEMSERI